MSLFHPAMMQFVVLWLYGHAAANHPRSAQGWTCYMCVDSNYLIPKKGRLSHTLGMNEEK
jgi:hypothetical protein